MNPIEIKRLLVEYKKVDAAKSEMELKIEERLSEVERIKENIKVQDARLEELKVLLSANGAEIK
jgi:hypothetical protein